MNQEQPISPRMRASSLLLATLALTVSSVSAQPRSTLPDARPPTRPTPTPLAPPASTRPPAAIPAATPLADSLSPEAAADYRAGLTLFDTGDYAAATTKFQAAFERSNDPRLLWNVAVCEKNQRHYAAVLRLLERYVQLGGAPTPELRSEADDVIHAVQPLVSTVQLRVDQPGAEVFVDEIASGTTPLPEPLHIDLGQRRIVLLKQGFDRYVIDREFAGGSQVEIDVSLHPAPREGQLQVLANAADSIQLDGKPVGQGQWQGTLLSGAHTLRVSRDGMQTYLKTVDVIAGKTHTLYVSLDAARSGGLPGWVWVGAGVLAAGGLAASGYFVLRSPRRVGPEQGTLGYPIGL